MTTHYTTEWCIEKRVLRLVVNSQFLTIDDMREINHDLTQCIHFGEPPFVHTIIDCRGIEKFQMNLPSIQQVLTFLREPLMGWLLIVSDDKLIGFVASLVTQLAGVRFRTFHTSDDAWVFLNSVDETLTVIPDTLTDTP